MTRTAKLRVVKPRASWPCDHPPVRLTYWPSQERAAAARASEYADNDSFNVRMARALIAKPRRSWWRRLVGR